jgi:methionyl-tRNA synthetase
MQIEKYDHKNLTLIYGIYGKLLDAPKEAVYMGSMLGHLAPGEATRNHAHHDHEQFIIIEGQGSFDNGHKKIAVQSGDVIHLKVGEYHTLKNEDKTKALTFTSLWWAYEKGADIPEKINIEGKIKRSLILSPPPTPNGDLHLGHLAGPYLAADILRRYWLQQEGTEVFYLTGSDDHQSYVALKASQMNLSPSAIANTFSDNIQSIFSLFDMSPTLFYRPLNNKDYIEFVQQFFKTLFAHSAIVPKTVTQPFCETCERWLFEAHIGGFCPNCQGSCGGGGCESCGFPNEGTDIIEPFCKYCKKTPSFRQTKKLYFPLKNYTKPLLTYWERLSLPPHIRALLRGLLEKGLPDIHITHHGEWGVNAPFEQFIDQNLCSWCEMVPGYLFSLQHNNPQKTGWKESWNDSDTKIVLFFGFDNTFFYTVLMPALLLAYDSAIKLPDNIIYNEFYLFEQQKFSTSRSHAVWAKDIIKNVSADVLRYYLAATRPEFERTQFSYAAFIELINQDLVNDLSAWILSLSKRVTTVFQGQCPDGGEWTVEHDEFNLFLHLFIRQCKEAYNPAYFSPATVIRLLRELVLRSKKLSAGTLFLQNNPFNKLEYQTSLVLELTALKYYALAIAPIMPTFSKNILQALHSSSYSFSEEIRLIAKGTSIGKLEHTIFHPLTIKQLNPADLELLS